MTALAMPLYRYEHLPKDAFRLLSIVNREGPVIQCALSTFPLDRPPAYSALSYTWGSATPGDGLTPDLDRTLVCNGSEVHITASLEHTLIRDGMSVVTDVEYFVGCLSADAS